MLSPELRLSNRELIDSVFNKQILTDFDKSNDCILSFIVNLLLRLLSLSWGLLQSSFLLLILVLCYNNKHCLLDPFWYLHAIFEDGGFVG